MLAPRRSAAEAHHWDWAPSTMLVTSLSSALLAALRLLPGIVVALEHQAAALPERLVLLLVQDLDRHGDLDQAPGDVDRAVLVAGVLRPAGRARSGRSCPRTTASACALGGLPEAEPALDRLAHRGCDFLRERRLGGLVVERQERHRLDRRRETAAGEAVETAGQAGGEEQRSERYGLRAVQISGAKSARAVERKVRSSLAGTLGTTSRAVSGTPVGVERRLGAPDDLAALAHLGHEPARLAGGAHVAHRVGRRWRTARRWSRRRPGRGASRLGRAVARRRTWPT